MLSRITVVFAVRCLVVAAGLSVSACASVSSQRFDQGDLRRTAVGQGYYVPKSLYRIEISRVSDTTLNVAIAPYLVADMDAGLRTLSIRPGVLSHDTVNITVDPVTSLLTTVTAAYDSRAAESATSFGSLMRPENNLLSGATVVATENFDPASATDRCRAARSLTSQLSRWAQEERARQPALPRNANAAARDARSAQNTTLAVAEAARITDAQARNAPCGIEGAGAIGLQFRWANESGDFTPSQTGAAACTTGVCVRAARPSVLVVTRGGVPVGSFAAGIPNGAPVTEVSVQGGIFADVNHTLAFSNGMLTTRNRVSGSELEGLGTTAVNFVTAAATAATSALTTETGRVNAQTSLVQARTKLIEAQTAYNAAAQDGGVSTTGQPEAAFQAPAAVWQATLIGPVHVAAPSTIVTAEVPRPPGAATEAGASTPGAGTRPNRETQPGGGGG